MQKPKINKTILISLLALVILAPILVICWNNFHGYGDKKESGPAIYYDYSNSLVGQRFKGLPKPVYPERLPFYGESIDIDKDGVKETVFYTIEHMTQSPHRAYIVKDSVIVFGTEEKSRVKILPVQSGSGFYISEFTMVNTKDARKLTLYQYKDGAFSKISEETSLGN